MPLFIELNGGENMENLFERIQRMISEIGLPVSSFCKSVGISTSAFYHARGGTLKLSDTTRARIDEFLSRFNY